MTKTPLLQKEKHSRLTHTGYIRFSPTGIWKKEKKFESRLLSISQPSKLQAWVGDASLTGLPPQQSPGAGRASLASSGWKCCLHMHFSAKESLRISPVPTCESLVGVCFLGSGFESPPFLLFGLCNKGATTEKGNRNGCDAYKQAPEIDQLAILSKVKDHAFLCKQVCGIYK